MNILSILQDSERPGDVVIRLDVVFFTAYDFDMQLSRYFPPLDSGYSTEMRKNSILDYEYPIGRKWVQFIKDKKYFDPSREMKQLLE